MALDLTGLTRATTPPEATASVALTGRALRVDASGLWVVPLGDDPRHPVGPCKGGWTADGTRVPPGTLVALVLTPDGPWVLGGDAPAHQDFLRRATATLTGGGIRTVTTNGNISWSQPFTIAGAGLRADEAAQGRLDIAMPGNGTVVPVHHSSARTSHTLAAGVVALSPDEALWYELPLGGAATSQPSRFHILASTLADGYEVPPNWVLVCRRTNWSSNNHAPEYLWGDGRAQDPWRTPSLNAGWSAGTIAPAYTKTHDGDVVLRGRVKSGTGAAFTLDPGYRPATTHTDFVREGVAFGATNLFTGAAPTALGAGGTVTPGVTYDGTTWTRVAATSAFSGARIVANLSDLVDGETYTASWEVANSGGAPVTIALDWCDAATTTAIIAPGERRRVYVTAALADYTSTYRFADLVIPSPGASASVLVREPVLTRGPVETETAGAAALITITTAGVVITSGSNTDHAIDTRFQAGS